VPGVRIFEGTSIFEAYSKLKRSLGEDAVILSTKHIKKGGMLGIGGKKFIQITASEPSPHAQHRISKNVSSAPKAVSQKGLTSHKTLSPQETSSTITSPDAMLSFQSDLKEIRQMIQDMQEHSNYKVWPDLPQEFQKAYEKLQKFNIADDIATALIHRWKGHYPNYKKGEKVDVRLLEKYIGEMLIPAGPIQLKTKGPTTVMLVGPTGVGKTTSIAKLAARYKIQQKKSVGLITIDTYRIAAVEQLRTYADLIGVPLKVIDSPKELQEAVQAFSDKDLILIDSAGRSPRHTEKMNELHQYVHAANADELHLVLSMSVGADVMADTLKRYQEFSVSKLLFTKLDEAVNYGAILGIIHKTQKPIGYITTGQEVPDDIEVVSQERLARLILHLDKIGG
jgi:flagellar biosynthesis protein FlhF